MEKKEEKIRAITKLYYSNPKIQEYLIRFSKNREVVPRYYEGFGKRPDTLQYPSDIMGLVNRGATSFHASEEIWDDPLKISSDMTPDEMNKIRNGWDLLIDIDSPYFDLSKLAAQLLIKALEHHGVNNYGIKFSGSKGLHIIVSGKAFPEEYNGKKMKDMFPEWPRAITEYLFKWIESTFMKEAGKIMSFGNKESVVKTYCLQCGRAAEKGLITIYRCPVCNLTAERKDIKSKRRLRCLNEGCAGVLEIENEREYYYCNSCKDPDNEKILLSSDRHPEIFERKRGENVSEHAKFDLVLVAPRHLFRMPYSLHEKTALASIVLNKNDIEKFSPKDANPLRVNLIEYMPRNEPGEAKKLLSAALEWKNSNDEKETKYDYKKYEGREYSEIDSSKINEGMFPEPIKRLLGGLKDGRKRGLFVLITFLKSLNFSPEYIIKKINEWNKLNNPPLKEGYVRSQIDWHLKQKKKILPPNYDNDSFYRDLGLIDNKPKAKNPIVEVMRKIRG